MAKKKASTSKGSVTDIIAESHSKAATQRVQKMVNADPAKFGELLALFLGDDMELARRAAWPLSYAVCDDPELISKHYPQIIAKLKKPDQHHAIYRNIFRFLEEIDIPKKHCATVYDLAVKYITSATQPVAVRAFALTTAANVCRTYPELGSELRVIIEQMKEETSPALIVRCRRILKELEGRSK